MHTIRTRINPWTPPPIQNRARAFPSSETELKSIIHFLSTNADNVLPEQTPGTPTDPDNILDFSITSRTATTELESVMDIVDTTFPVTLFGYGNEISYTRLERLMEEMNVVPQSFDLRTRSDGPVLGDTMDRLTGGGDYPKFLLKGELLGSAAEVMKMALNGKLAKKLRDAGVEATDGDPYSLRDIVAFW